MPKHRAINYNTAVPPEFAAAAALFKVLLRRTYGAGYFKTISSVRLAGEYRIFPMKNLSAVSGFFSLEGECNASVPVITFESNN